MSTTPACDWPQTLFFKKAWTAYSIIHHSSSRNVSKWILRYTTTYNCCWSKTVCFEWQFITHVYYYKWRVVEKKGEWTLNGKHSLFFVALLDQHHYVEMFRNVQNIYTPEELWSISHGTTYGTTYVLLIVLQALLSNKHIGKKHTCLYGFLHEYNWYECSSNQLLSRLSLFIFSVQLFTFCLHFSNKITSKFCDEIKKSIKPAVVCMTSWVQYANVTCFDKETSCKLLPPCERNNGIL